MFTLIVAVCLGGQTLQPPFKNYDELDEWRAFKSKVSSLQHVRVTAKQFEFRTKKPPEFELPRRTSLGGTKVVLSISASGKVRIEEEGNATLLWTKGGVEAIAEPNQKADLKSNGLSLWHVLSPAFEKGASPSLKSSTVIRRTKEILLAGTCEALLEEGRLFRSLEITDYHVDSGSRWTYWFDAKTSLPVEVTWQSLGPMAEEFGLRWTDLEWDWSARANSK